MTTMITEVYEALRAAGVPEEQAENASEVFATFNERITKLESSQKVTMGVLIVLAGLLALMGYAWFSNYFYYPFE